MFSPSTAPGRKRRGARPKRGRRAQAGEEVRGGQFEAGELPDLAELGLAADDSDWQEASSREKRPAG